MKLCIPVLQTALLVVGLAGCKPPAMAQEFVRLTATGPVSGEIDHVVDRARVEGDAVGIVCMGPWPTINISLAESGERPFGIQLQMRLPADAGAGDYALSITGADNSARVSMQFITDGSRTLGVVQEGQLAIEALDEGYAGTFDMTLRDGDAQTLSGSFRITLTTGNCP